MTRLEIRARIKSEFGSIANFCRAAGLDIKQTSNFLSRPDPTKGDTPTIAKRVKELEKMLTTADRSKIDERYISAKERAEVFLKIRQVSGDVLTFCQVDYPEWSYSFVNNFVSNNGRLVIKNDKVRRFIAFIDGL